MSEWQEAKAPQYPSIRWTQEAKPGKEDSTVYLGAQVMGLYLEKKEDIGSNNSCIYLLQLADGKKVNIWGTMVIDDRMKLVPIGYQVRFTFNGYKKAKESGRQPWADIMIEYAKPMMQEAGASAPSAPASAPAASQGIPPSQNVDF